MSVTSPSDTPRKLRILDDTFDSRMEPSQFHLYLERLMIKGASSLRCLPQILFNFEYKNLKMLSYLLYIQRHVADPNFALKKQSKSGIKHSFVESLKLCCWGKPLAFFPKTNQVPVFKVNSSIFVDHLNRVSPAGKSPQFY